MEPVPLALPSPLSGSVPSWLLQTPLPKVRPEQRSRAGCLRLPPAGWLPGLTLETTGLRAPQAPPTQQVKH